MFFSCWLVVPWHHFWSIHFFKWPLHVFIYATSDWSFSFIPIGHYFDYFPQEMNSNGSFQPRAFPDSNVQMESFDNQQLISMMMPNETYGSGIVHPATSTKLWPQENHSLNMDYCVNGMVCFIQIRLRNHLSLQLTAVSWNIWQSSACLFVQRVGSE